MRKQITKIGRPGKRLGKAARWAQRQAEIERGAAAADVVRSAAAGPLRADLRGASRRDLAAIADKITSKGAFGWGTSSRRDLGRLKT